MSHLLGTAHLLDVEPLQQRVSLMSHLLGTVHFQVALCSFRYILWGVAYQHSEQKYLILLLLAVTARQQDSSVQYLYRPHYGQHIRPLLTGVQ